MYAFLSFSLKRENNVLLRVSFDPSGYTNISLFSFKKKYFDQPYYPAFFPCFIIAATPCFLLLSFLQLELHHILGCSYSGFNQSLLRIHLMLNMWTFSYQKGLSH